MTIYILTIQWRSWDRTVEAFSTHDIARARLDAIIRDQYPDEEIDSDRFAERGHSWWIDEVEVAEAAS